MWFYSCMYGEQITAIWFKIMVLIWYSLFQTKLTEVICLYCTVWCGIDIPELPLMGGWGGSTAVLAWGYMQANFPSWKNSCRATWGISVLQYVVPCSDISRSFTWAKSMQISIVNASKCPIDRTAKFRYLITKPARWSLFVFVYLCYILHIIRVVKPIPVV